MLSRYRLPRRSPRARVAGRPQRVRGAALATPPPAAVERSGLSTAALVGAQAGAGPGSSPPNGRPFRSYTPALIAKGIANLKSDGVRYVLRPCEPKAQDGPLLDRYSDNRLAHARRLASRATQVRSSEGRHYGGQTKRGRLRSQASASSRGCRSLGSASARACVSSSGSSWL
jgi:hypothetical protein